MHPRTIYISVFLGALLLVIVRLFGEVSVARLLDVQKSVDFRQGAVIQLERLVSDCKDIQRGTRGFAASGDPRFLELSERGLRSAQTNVQDLRRKFTSRPAELALLGRIEQGLERITAHGRDTLMAPRKAQHLGALTYDDQLLIDALGTDVVMLQQKEAAGIAADEKAAREWSAQSTLLRTAGAVLVAAVLIGAFFTMRREIIQRTLAERTTASANEALKVQVAEGTRRSGEMELLNELSELLQVSTSLEETRDMFAVYGRHLFPGVNGAVYTHKPSRNALDLAAFWGEEPAAKVLALDDCWALRRGRVHATGTEEQSLVCGHSGARAASLCIPMLAHGEAVGVLHLNAASADLLAGPTALLARTVADQVSLALANLRLQESLRTRAVRDPLTGLFNRRYLEETLSRDLSRAQRGGGHVGVMMIDIDHFKHFNDTFGHSGGDALLKQLAKVMQQSFRAEDVVCRYGGEEFVITVAETDANMLRSRAEELRRAAKNIHVRVDGRSLGLVTVSIGLALSPDDGKTVEMLMAGADRALYEAKANGRDNVVGTQAVSNLRLVAMA